MTDGKLIPEFLRPKVEVSHLTSSNIDQLYTTIIYFQSPSNDNTIYNKLMDKMIVLYTHSCERKDYELKNFFKSNVL